MPRGGARPNPGPKKGAKYKPTLAKEEMRQLYREALANRLPEIIEAQFDSAKGVLHMMAKDNKTGQWIQVTDPAIMVKCLNSGPEFYKIQAQNPNVQAIRDMLDRLMDQPLKGVEISGAEGGPLEVVVKTPW